MKKRICLAIETTANYLGLAFHLFDTSTKTSRPMLTEFSVADKRQSDLIIPRIDYHLKRLKAKKSDLGLIAADVGPGSFTGVRVGVAAARGLAQGLNVPCVGVGSLEALAAHAQPSANVVAPYIPALSGEAYFAVYQNGKQVVPPTWGAIRLFEKVMEKYKRLGIQKVEGVPHPDVIASKALAMYFKDPKSKKWSYEFLSPMYLQPSWAERK